jgi:hypothetical protein
LNRGVWEVLVAWQGHPASDTTWVAVQEFNAAYPDVQLMDELFLGEEGNIIDSFVGQFYRTRKAQPNKE